MTDLKKNSYTLIKIFPFISMLFFMMGLAISALGEYDSFNYLRMIGIIPVCFALLIPYCTKDLKNYSKLILGLLSIVSICQCIVPAKAILMPLANDTVLYHLFNISLQKSSAINAIIVLAAFFSMVFLNKKCKQNAVWVLILMSLGSVLFALITDPLMINRCDYCFSVSYIMLLLSVLISFDFCPEGEDRTA